MNINPIALLVTSLLISNFSAIVDRNPSLAVQPVQPVSAIAVVAPQRSPLKSINRPYQTVKRGLPGRREGGGTR